jgi:GNAT superfamily N-acetyltransferase
VAVADTASFLADPATVAIVAVDALVRWPGGLGRQRHPCGYSQLMLYEIEVAGEVRRQGIGSQLMAAVLQLAKREAQAGVYLFTTEDNLPAQALYRSAGDVADRERGSWLLLELALGSAARSVPLSRPLLNFSSSIANLPRKGYIKGAINGHPGSAGRPPASVALTRTVTAFLTRSVRRPGASVGRGTLGWCSTLSVVRNGNFKGLRPRPPHVSSF